jgi:cation-transporting ATPase 13A2
MTGVFFLLQYLICVIYII